MFLVFRHAYSSCLGLKQERDKGQGHGKGHRGGLLHVVESARVATLSGCIMWNESGIFDMHREKNITHVPDGWPTIGLSGRRR